MAHELQCTQSEFGKLPDGTPIRLFTLTNQSGARVQLSNYGAILVSIEVPDRDGHLANVTAGFSSLDGYLERHPYFGATVGRYCNRIAKGRFVLDGKEYSLAINNGPNHLHGGEIGFDKKVWSAEELKTEGAVGVRFRLTSPDGEEGYPGTLQVIADYLWDNQSTLTLKLEATTDKPTVLNLTNHAYFNLTGDAKNKIDDHRLQLASNQYLLIDSDMIPTGVFANVSGTPLDFRQPHAIGDRIGQLTATSGYDHCFVVEGKAGELRPCARVVDPRSGRAMEMLTTQVGVQFYSGNFLNGSPANAGYAQHHAFCLETQHYPDSPNHPDFPTTVLLPEQKFSETTTFRFFVEK